MAATVAAPARRVQGRPVRGEGDVGRDKLVEAARALLRTPIAAGLSRKAVADAAGVTPALVSYYFPDKNGLLAAATAPLIGQRIQQLLAILELSCTRRERLQRVVALFIGMHEAEAHLIDHAFNFCREAVVAGGKNALLDAYDRLRAFFVEGSEAGDWRAVPPDQFLFALWGMCKFVTQLAPPSGPAASTRHRAETVIDLAFNGLRKEGEAPVEPWEAAEVPSRRKRRAA